MGAIPGLRECLVGVMRGAGLVLLCLLGSLTMTAFVVGLFLVKPVLKAWLTG